MAERNRVYKERGKDRKPNLEVNLEEFIAVKGISALGNQLTREKINQVNLLDPLPYEAPEVIPADSIEVIDEEEVKVDQSPEAGNSNDSEQKVDGENGTDDEGQITLF